MLARRVSELAASAEVFGLKIPNSAGGAGNAVLDSAAVRGRPLHEVADVLRPVVAGIQWDGNSPLLIDLWETDVLCSPSAQLWIPPESVGEPVIEGLFVQQLGGRVGEFVGATAAQLPAPLATDLATRSWLLGRLFQRLGYVGRCSFDLILAGKSLADCRLEFIECNGRWGGTSLPMSLMNRLFGDWQRQPFAVQVVTAPGLDGITFSRLTERLRGELYDRRSGQGRLILYTPGRMRLQSSVSALALGPTWKEAIEFLAQSVPLQLANACRGFTDTVTTPVITGARE